MSQRDRILARLRQAQPPFASLAPIEESRPVTPRSSQGESGRVNQFIAAARELGSYVYQVDRSEAIEQIMDLLDGDQSALSWDGEQLPLAGLQETLRSLGVAIAAPDDGDARVGITGVSAALAATGSLVLESGRGRYRGASLLPDLHIALLRPDQILPDLESWREEQAQAGYTAFRDSSNTVIVTGPSKTADIGHQLVKGAHGPRELHVMIVK